MPYGFNASLMALWPSTDERVSFGFYPGMGRSSRAKYIKAYRHRVMSALQ